MSHAIKVGKVASMPSVSELPRWRVGSQSKMVCAGCTSEHQALPNHEDNCAILQVNIPAANTVTEIRTHSCEVRVAVCGCTSHADTSSSWSFLAMSIERIHLPDPWPSIYSL